MFLTRYLDLFTNFHGVYNSVMKVVFIAGMYCVNFQVSTLRIVAHATSLATCPHTTPCTTRSLGVDCLHAALSKTVQIDI